MELHLGKMTGQEIANWLNISYNGTYRKNPQKYIALLNGYCDYNIVRGGVIINKIYISNYSKKGSDTFEKVKSQIDDVWSETGLDSCSRVGSKIYYSLVEADKDFNLAETTVYQYTVKGRNELYGKPFMERGTLGHCIYLWCKKEPDGRYSLLTPEEEQVKKDLQIKYFGDTTEKQIFIKSMVEAGEIKKEDAWEELEKITNMGNDNFMVFLEDILANLK